MESPSPANDPNNPNAVPDDGDSDEELAVADYHAAAEARLAERQAIEDAKPPVWHGLPSQVGGAHLIVKAFGLCPGPKGGCTAKCAPGEMCPIHLTNRVLGEQFVRHPWCENCGDVDPELRSIHTKQLWGCTQCNVALCSTCIDALEASEKNLYGDTEGCRAVRTITRTLGDGSKDVQKVWMCECCAQDVHFRGMKTSDVVVGFQAPEAGERTQRGADRMSDVTARFEAAAVEGGLGATAPKKEKFAGQGSGGYYKPKNGGDTKFKVRTIDRQILCLVLKYIIIIHTVVLNRHSHVNSRMHSVVILF